jgi:hypothetical protein
MFDKNVVTKMLLHRIRRSNGLARNKYVEIITIGFSVGPYGFSENPGKISSNIFPVFR